LGRANGGVCQVEPLRITASLRPGGIVLEWPGVTGNFYTLLQSSNLSLPFSVLASNIPALPPGNLYTDAVSTTASRFYRLRIQP
jgi:hypothetical protein